MSLRRVVEPRPGLGWARNTGLAAASGTIVAYLAASGTIVAYLDDDEHPDRHWLAELARGFTLDRRVAAVSWLMLPGTFVYWPGAVTWHGRGARARVKGRPG